MGRRAGHHEIIEGDALERGTYGRAGDHHRHAFASGSKAGGGDQPRKDRRRSRREEHRGVDGAALEARDHLAAEGLGRLRPVEGDPPHRETGGAEHASKIPPDLSARDDQKRAAQRIEPADHQAGQRLSIAVDALDLAEVSGPSGGHAGIAKRDHRYVAPSTGGGEGAHSVRTGEHHGLHAGKRPLERGGRAWLLRGREQRIEQDLVAVRAQRGGKLRRVGGGARDEHPHAGTPIEKRRIERREAGPRPRAQLSGRVRQGAEPRGGRHKKAIAFY